jgi:hypothetical protein
MALFHAKVVLWPTRTIVYQAAAPQTVTTLSTSSYGARQRHRIFKAFAVVDFFLVSVAGFYHIAY